jgi:hypothetical protein
MGQTTLDDHSVLITGKAGFMRNPAGDELSGANEKIVIYNCLIGCLERFQFDIRSLRGDASESDAFGSAPSEVGVVHDDSQREDLPHKSVNTEKDQINFDYELTMALTDGFSSAVEAVS